MDLTVGQLSECSLWEVSPCTCQKKATLAEESKKQTRTKHQATTSKALKLSTNVHLKYGQWVTLLIQCAFSMSVKAIWKKEMERESFLSHLFHQRQYNRVPIFIFIIIEYSKFSKIINSSPRLASDLQWWVIPEDSGCYSMHLTTRQRVCLCLRLHAAVLLICKFYDPEYLLMLHPKHERISPP